MSISMLRLATCADAFTSSPIPVWVLDIETIRVVWANPIALEFWQASTVEELAARDMLKAIPEVVLIRLRKSIERLQEGTPFQEDWTFYPKGKPMPVILHIRSIELANGRIGMLNQAMRINEAESSTAVRALTMMRHAKAAMVFVNASGEILAQNAGSIAEFGPLTSWLNWMVNREEAEQIIQIALTNNTMTKQAKVMTTNGERIHSIIAHELRDPVTGEMGVLIQHFDITDRIEAEKMVQTHLTTLREQQREILELSTPFLDIGAQTLALPIVGRIDEARITEINAKLLNTIASRGIRRVIIDITGVVSVQSSHLTFLRQLVQATSLLGATAVVTGIRSDLARMLAASDETLAGITVKRSLADGLASYLSYRKQPQ